MLTTKITNRVMAVTLAIALTYLTGCATRPNPFEQNYRDIKATVPPKYQNLARTPLQLPKVILCDNIKPATIKAWVDQGYLNLGYSDFGGVGVEPTKAELLAWAKKVGAEVVLYSVTQKGTQQGVKTVPVYQPGINLMANTTGNATAYGPGGQAYGNYGQTTTVTSPGTISSVVVPVTMRDQEFFAVFFAYKKPEHLTPKQKALGI